MKSFATSQAVVFGVLLLAGAALRICFRDLPNFAPVAAISLFAGYYFPSWRMAAFVAPAIMLASDSVIGFYRPTLMLTVYAMLMLPVLARGVLRRTFRLDAASAGSAGLSYLGLVGCSLATSVAFFLVTNFACWYGGTGYSQDFAGFAHCYTQALPFFRNTLLGDLFFSCFLFGAYTFAVRYGYATLITGRLQPVPVQKS